MWERRWVYILKILYNIVSSHLSTAETVFHIRFAHETRTMKFQAVILLLGVCFPYWTISSPVKSGNYLLNIDKGTLNNVTIIVNSSDIDLSGLQIGYIGKTAFDNLAHIKTLNLSNNALDLLPPLVFSKLSNLEELTLANNKIFGTDQAFIGLDNLKFLNLSNNRITFLDTTYLTGLKKSTEILIEGNPVFEFFIKIPRNSSLSEDESFELSIIDEDSEKPIPSNFRVKVCKTDEGTVESLEVLKQNETLGNCMQADMWNYEGLILLTNLGLKKFKRGWFKLSSDFIHFIDLSNNKIADITPELLNDLPLPLNINLSYNKIRVIKKNIIENKHCVGLNLNGNSPLVIEDCAFEKLCLKELGVDQTGLNNLSFIRTLPITIELLVLSRNGISEIPSNTFRGLKKLQVIDLSYNNLENIESGTFIDQKNLSVIRLAGNRIRHFNFELFKDSSALREIHLSFNKIKEITMDTFFGLRHLHRFNLDLSYNEIDYIGEGSFSHFSMSTLDLTSNKIIDESIVKGAFNMCRVRYLDLSRNSIRNLSGELFSGILGNYTLELFRNPIKSVKNFIYYKTH